MRTSRIITESVLLLLFIGVLVGCRHDDAQSQKATKPKPVLVQVVEVKPHQLQSTLDIVGTIEPKVSAKITAPTDGVIEELHVKENDIVQKNQVVGILSSSDRLALLGETQARLERAKSQSRNDEELRRATEDREYADRLFLGTPIVSPIAGRVINKPIELGSVVSARQLLLTVAGMNYLIIRTAVSELLLTRLKLGQKLAVRVDAYPDQQFVGTISLISPEVNPATRTGDIEVRVNDASGRLKPGMLATVTIVTERRENAVAIPGDALMTRADGQTIVFVAEDSTALQRVITTGIITRTETEITSGLQPGDRVVVMGQELLKEGMPIKVQDQKRKSTKGNTSSGEGVR